MLESPEAAEKVQPGDELHIDLTTGKIWNATRQEEYQAAAYPPAIMEIIQAGGLINSVRNKIAARKAAEEAAAADGGGDGMTDYRVLCLPGDGIGTEIMAEARKVLEAVGERFGHTFQFREGLVGLAAIEAYGTALREEELQAGRESDAILFGAVGGAVQDTTGTVRPEDAIFGLRKTFNFYANLRPVKVTRALIDASPVKAEVIEGTDILVLRELTGGLYFGSPKERRTLPDGSRAAVDTLYYTEGEIRRVVRLACELARGRRGKVTSVDKANVLMTSRLWRESRDGSGGGVSRT